jgi:hypothetical protein
VVCADVDSAFVVAAVVVVVAAAAVVVFDGVDDGAGVVDEATVEFDTCDVAVDWFVEEVTCVEAIVEALTVAVCT